MSIQRIFYPFLLFVLYFVPLLSCNFHDFDVYQHKLSRKYVEEKIQTYLQKEIKTANYFAISDKSFTLFSSPTAKEKGEPEYTLFFGSEKFPSPKKGRRGLDEARIAIDPGHLGGIFARLEKRFIAIPYEGKLIEFDEGTQTLLTALYLQNLLEAKGAKVLLTRREIGKSVYKNNFFKWLTENPQFWDMDRPLPFIFRTYYNPLDLKARAEKINQFQPDFTLFIHFNAHDPSEESSANDTMTEVNFNMVFVPGAFSGEEMKDKESRYHFLRLICTSDLENSIIAGKKVIQSFTNTLHISPVKGDDPPSYLKKFCIEVSRGVFARNLSVNRRVRGANVYGESLIQNNSQECIRLAKKDFSVHNIPCSNRIKEVAWAYFIAIQNFFHGQEDE